MCLSTSPGVSLTGGFSHWENLGVLLHRQLMRGTEFQLHFLSYFLWVAYLFIERQRERWGGREKGKERESEYEREKNCNRETERNLLSMGSLPKQLQVLELGLLEARKQQLRLSAPRGCRDTWTDFCCFLQAVARSWIRSGKSQDSSQRLMG